MRDCVRQAFENGSAPGCEFKKMRHAIIVEHKRLGASSSEIKDELLEWNKRCESPLSIGKQRSQLMKYVDWTDKKECKIGCNALKDYCIGESRCEFYKRKTLLGREIAKHNPLDFDRVESYLESHYKVDAYVMMLILKVLRRTQVENAKEVILIGIRGIVRKIRDVYQHAIDKSTIIRRMEDLISEGILEKTIKGKRGTFSGKANGYRFLAWTPPEGEHKNP